MKYPSLADLPDIRDKYVLVRLDFNVPVQKGAIVDDYRIKKSLPTINYLRERGAKVVIISHMEEEPHSLKPVYEYLKALLPITFCQDCIEEGTGYREKLKAGEVLLCENLRLYGGEKKNDEGFSRKLAAMGDFFVNDAFSVSHRKHASIVGIPKFLPSFIGLQFEDEIANLSTCFSPEHPFIFILGGAKFDTKLPLIQKFLSLADVLFVGGALATDIYKAQGIEIGKSLVSDASIDLTSYINNPKLVVAGTVIVDSPEGRKTVSLKDMMPDYYIGDDAPESLDPIREKIISAKHILWNGPLGNYENGFKEGTFELARIIAEATKNGAKSILGGGDTLAAISELGLDSSFTFVSTGGGAMLDYLANGSLPGLDVLKARK
jgi:3-phosphoglycerate kinase